MDGIERMYSGKVKGEKEARELLSRPGSRKRWKINRRPQAGARQICGGPGRFGARFGAPGGR